MSFKQVAKKAVTFSELMQDRKVIQTEDILKYYPDGITIIAAERVELPDDKQPDGVAIFYVTNFEEDETKFYNTGAVLTRVLDECMESVDGDVEEFNTQLAEGLKVKLGHKKTKNNYTVTTVEII